jgi:hypothetical protein
MEDGRVVGYSRNVQGDGWTLGKSFIGGDVYMTRTKYPTEEQIQARAYQLYLERGGQHGHDTDDWLQAEYELVQLPIQKIAKLGVAPPKRKENRKLALVHLVQAALFLGAETLPHIKA